MPRLPLLGASLFLLASCSVSTLPPGQSPARPLGHGQPLPTERADGQEEGEENQDERRAWMEAMHRAAPGVDWRAEEDRNRRALMAEREQALLSPLATAGSWDEIGSRNLAGSVFVSTPSSDGTELYVGTALGGVFRGPADGSSWVAIGDGVYGGALHVGVVPAAGGGQDIVLRADNNSLWRSVDGGLTWQNPAGVSTVYEVRRLLVLEDAGSTVLFLARIGSTWSLYRSTDRGASFSVTYTTTEEPDIFAPRDVAGTVELFDGDHLERSLDGGVSFSPLGVGVGFQAEDVRFGGHEVSGGTTFSCALRHNGVWELWRTTDSGVSWSHPRDMPEMWSAFVTSMTDADILAYGGVEFWVSRNGGSSFAKVNEWWEHPGNRQNKLHADIMGATVEPDASLASGERWYINTHGGNYQSLDQAQTVDWLAAERLAVSQYYNTLTSRRDPDEIHAGSQDQGYQRAVGNPFSGPGGSRHFVEDITGDYGHLSSTSGAHDFVYSDYPGFILISIGEGVNNLFTEDFPSGFAGQWLPFMVADPEDEDVFYLCGERIWKYDRPGANYDWNYSQLGSKVFTPAVTSLAFSPIDPQRAWCCTSDGKIYYSTDRGVTWTQSNTNGPGAHYFYGTTIVPSSVNPDMVWIAGSGYSTAPVKVSFNGGVSFSDRRDGMPNTLVYGMVEAPDGSGRMYAAASTGAWEYEPTTQQWSSILGAEAPITTYWSVETVPSRNLIRFGTYGRGIWDFAPDTPGFFPYGELRGRPNHLDLVADSRPLLGRQVLLTVTGAPANATGFLSVSLAEDDVAMFGGDLLIDLNQVVWQKSMTADASGTASTSISIPNNPALIGAERFLQATFRDASQSQGWALSHGLRAVVGQ